MSVLRPRHDGSLDLHILGSGAAAATFGSAVANFARVTSAVSGGRCCSRHDDGQRDPRQWRRGHVRSGTQPARRSRCELAGEDTGKNARGLGRHRRLGRCKTVRGERDSHLDRQARGDNEHRVQACRVALGAARRGSDCRLWFLRDVGPTPHPDRWEPAAEHPRALRAPLQWLEPEPVARSSVMKTDRAGGTGDQTEPASARTHATAATELSLDRPAPRGPVRHVSPHDSAAVGRAGTAAERPSQRVG